MPTAEALGRFEASHASMVGYNTYVILKCFRYNNIEFTIKYFYKSVNNHISFKY